MFVIGPKACGKTTICNNVASRTNMKHIDYIQWKKESGNKDAGDEEGCQKLIESLAHEIHPRILMENFPENETQAKYFLRNCKKPTNVFGLVCSIDVS